MRCYELVRTLAERNVTLRVDGEKIKISDPEKAVDLLPWLKENRAEMLLLATGKAKIACPDLLSDGMCHGCVCCEEWFPLTGSVSKAFAAIGLCMEREHIAPLMFTVR
ncbi:hypothetical protein FACS1894204_12450 [Synergistales bacterium]|nr:hypothetical protein FACS1894204_12450 [Synergistales bacterium]